MKICVFSNLYPPVARGGAERIAAEVAEGLSQKGHEVFVVSLRPPKPLKGEEAGFQNKVRVVRLPVWNLYHPLRDFSFPRPVRFVWLILDLFHPLYFWRAWRILRREKPDVVVTHNLKGIGLTIPLAIRARRLPWAHHLHDIQLVVPSGLVIFQEEQKNFLVRGGRWLHSRACRLLFGSPDLVISPSRFLQTFYRERKFFPKSPWRVCPNPVSFCHGKEPQRRPEIESAPLSLLFLGQLEIHKGLIFLIHALQSWDADWSLTVAGAGRLKARILREATRDQRIHFVGKKDRAEIWDFLNACDAVVVPSLCYENFPSVIGEAFVAGRPVIASRIGGVGERVEEGQNGFLFPPGNRAEFQKVLGRFFLERDAWAGRAEMIRQNAAQFSLTTYIEAYDAWLKNLSHLA